MTSSSTDTVVPSVSPTVSNGHGLLLQVADSGALSTVQVDDCSVLLYPAGALADGLAGVWLRRRDPNGPSVVSLVGQTTPTRPVADGSTAADRRGVWRDLLVEVSLRPSTDRAAWFWHVCVTNTGAETVEVDLVHAQDVALAPVAAVRNNEYYVSQYLDLSPVAVPGHGVALGVRQNMPGPTPWLLVGCLGQAERWATDAIQLTGPGRPEGAPWPGLRVELPGMRRQGEHSVAALQTVPATLAPGASWTSGFYGLYLPDHPAATSDADARYADEALSDPAAAPPEPAAGPGELGEADHRSLFGTAPALTCRPLTSEELRRLAGPDQRQAEYDGEELLSFFTSDGAHVVTAAKQARVLRPHGHLFRSGTRLVPDEPSVCATVWMDGTFCSQLSHGHVGLGTILSVRRSYLGLAPAHGLRIFVRADPGDGWSLLGTPSGWQVAPQECRWWYARGTSMIQVSTRIAAGSDTVEIAVEILDGRALELLVAAEVCWLDADSPGDQTPEPDGLRLTPPADSGTARLFPGGSLGLRWTPGDTEVDDDRALFLDGRSRGLPWLTLRTAARRSWALTLTPALVEPDGTRDPAAGGPTTAPVELLAPDSTAGAELTRIATALPWFTHDALIHYLSPRGLEQYSGGAWGTRDVSQGPVGLLLTLGAHAELRELVLLVFGAQLPAGDWPQSFEFLARHRQPGASGAHGDVVYWPLLALGQYLAATGDHSVLSEPVVADDDAVSVTDRVRTALDHIETTLIAGTGLPAYGHGDWNDSLQPVDPEFAARLCSTWTVVLQAHALGVLGTELGRYSSTRDLGARAERIAAAGVTDLRRLLLVDGVLAGYGLFDDPSPDGPNPDGSAPAVEPLIHPRGDRTGLSYSILPMIHAISADLLTAEEATHHLQLIRDHLWGPDGARLFDRPVGYAGGPMTLFQRAEASTFFGREIGIMYTHAHLRYAEALARVGDGPGLLAALALAQPVGITDRVPSARRRQSTCYYSSSDAAFADRYQAAEHYDEVVEGTVGLEGGWRVYSSGPGLFLQLVVQCQLGVRRRGDLVELDPVLDPGLDGLVARIPLLGLHRAVRYRVGPRGHGVTSVRLGDEILSTTVLANPYRVGGVAIRVEDLERAGADSEVVVEIRTG